MHAALEAVQVGDHVVAIYPAKETKLEAAFQFLKAGLDANEAVVLITNDLPKDEIRGRMRRQWQIDLSRLEAEGDITIATTREWYFPDGKVDIGKLVANWDHVTSRAVARGKRGVRTFGDMAEFFSNGFSKEAVDYESALDAKFNIPVTAMCAYEDKHISGMPPEQFATLRQCHGVHQMEGRNVLANPQDNNHILMVYDGDSDAHEAIASYINEGLKRNQLCVYASVHNREKSHVKKIASRIVDYEKNVQSGNLLVANLAPVYVAAVCDDLSPYKELAAQLGEMTKNRKDKHVRLVADCATFMFKNKHFDACTLLEAWGQEKPIFGSYVCPYPKSLFDKYPFDYQKLRILANHDVAIDAAGHIITEYHGNADPGKEAGQ